LDVIEQVGTILPSINQVRARAHASTDPPSSQLTALVVMPQIELHPYVLSAAEPLLAKMAEADVKVASYGPLSSVFRFPGGPVDEPVAKAATRLNVSENNVLLRWALQRGAGEVVTTSSKIERLKEALSIHSFELTAQEVCTPVDAKEVRAVQMITDSQPVCTRQVEEIGAAGKSKHQRVFMKHMDNDA
jgi:diketogulonate reductase-like aldo/keto reductase